MPIPPMPMKWMAPISRGTRVTTAIRRLSFPGRRHWPALRPHRQAAPRRAALPGHGAAAALWARAAGPLKISISRRASFSGVSSRCATRQPAPALARISALGVWLSSSAPGSGTRMAGRPIAISSATVPAPERAITRCACAMRSGRSEKKGRQLGGDFGIGVDFTHLLHILGATLLHHPHRVFRSRGSWVMAAGTISDSARAPWLPPKTSRCSGPPNIGAS